MDCFCGLRISSFFRRASFRAGCGPWPGAAAPGNDRRRLHFRQCLKSFLGLGGKFAVGECLDDVLIELLGIRDPFRPVSGGGSRLDLHL